MMTTAAPTASLPLSALLRQPVTGPHGHRFGVLADLVVQLGHGGYPPVTGLVVAVRGTQAFVAASDLAVLEAGLVQLAVGTVDLDGFRPRESEALLAEGVMGHRLIDITRGAIVRAYDVHLAPVPNGWAATGLDVHRRHWLASGPKHAAHPQRDWNDFEPLIGHAHSAHVRAARDRIHQLKASRIAHILDQASRHEHLELLARIHKHPELEAEVFDQLDRPV